MPKAVWNGRVIADSPSVEIVEGNSYFPPDSLDRSLVKPSATTSVCPWKGTARYYTLVVDGEENPDAVWYYPEPKPAAANIKDHFAFWKGVTIEP